MLHIILFSLIAGFVNSLPTGPAGAFVVAKRITQGPRYMFVAIFGVVLSDHIFIILAVHAQKLQTVFSFYTGQISYIPNILAGVILLGGISMLLHKPKSLVPKNIQNKNTTTLFEAFFVGFLINSINPLAFLNTPGILQVFHIEPHTGTYAPIIISYTIGAILLWILIGYIIHKMADRSEKIQSYIIRMCGVVLVVSSLVFLVKSFGIV